MGLGEGLAALQFLEERSGSGAFEQGFDSGFERAHKRILQEQGDRRQKIKEQIGVFLDTRANLNGEERKNADEIFLNWTESHSREDLPFVRGIVKATPLGPEARLREAAKDRLGPRPVNPYDAETQSLQFAQASFDQINYDNRFQKLIGIEPGDIPETISINATTYGYRKKGSTVVKLISIEDEKWNEIASGLNITKELLAANDFKWHTGPSFTIQNGDSVEYLTPMKDFVTGRNYLDHMRAGPAKEVSGAGGAKDKKMPEASKDTLEFDSFHAIMDITDKDDLETMAQKTVGGRQFMQYKTLIDGGMDPNEALQRTVGQLDPTLNFRLVDPGKYTEPWLWFNGYKRGAGEFITWFPGKLTKFEGKDGTIHLWYADEMSGKVWADDGRLIGDKDKAIEIGQNLEGVSISPQEAVGTPAAEAIQIPEVTNYPTVAERQEEVNKFFRDLKNIGKKVSGYIQKKGSIKEQFK